MFLEKMTLVGERVRLEPLAQAHCADLQIAVADGELWKLWYTFIPKPEDMAGEIARRLALKQTTMNPFAVIDLQTGRAVGMTTYMNIDVAHRHVEIGSTWLAQSVWRGSVNSEMKYLMLQHAFEGWDCIAVDFCTHFFNQRSRRAIERLGAKLDGILRNRQIVSHPDAPNTLRDTCVYSIIASEWPTVKAHLQHKLRQYKP